MLDFNVNIGYVECEKQKNEKIHKPFYLNISQFPSLFIDRKYFGMDDITSRIMTKCLSFRTNDRVKSVVIDNYEIVHNSMFKPGTFRHNRPDSMLKRINTFASKLYEDCKRNPDFFPYTKYIIIVNKIEGLEKELLDILPKLGEIGMYLILADNAKKFENYPYLFLNLFGKLTYVDFDSLENKPEIKYTTTEYDTEYVDKLPIPQTVYRLERFRLYPETYPIIYTDDFYKKFCSTLESNREWYALENNFDLPTRSIADKIRDES